MRGEERCARQSACRVQVERRAGCKEDVARRGFIRRPSHLGCRGTDTGHSDRRESRRDGVTQGARYKRPIGRNARVAACVTRHHLEVIRSGRSQIVQGYRVEETERGVGGGRRSICGSGTEREMSRGVLIGEPGNGGTRASCAGRDESYDRRGRVASGRARTTKTELLGDTGWQLARRADGRGAILQYPSRSYEMAD